MIDGLPALFSTSVDVALIALVALIGVAAAVAEAWHRLTGGPRVVGYAATGLVFGAFGLSEVPSTLPLPAWMRLLFDLALGVMLFELGGRVRLGWFRHNPWILVQSLAAGGAAGCAVYWALTTYGGMDGSSAMACALLAVAGSPAVLLRVVGDSSASGQVTERAVVLTAIGTLAAIVGARLFTGALLYSQQQTDLTVLASTLYLLGGSVLMAALLALVSTRLGHRMDGSQENAALLQLSVLALAVLGARALGLSSLLVPLLAGLMIKQLSPRPWAWPRQFGTAAGVVVVLMFVLTAAAWNAALIAAAVVPALVLLASRWVAGSVVLLAFSWPSSATGKQALATAFCMVPMCGTALVIASDIVELVPHPLLPDFVPTVVATAALAELLGALLAWGALRVVGETSSH